MRQRFRSSCALVTALALSNAGAQQPTPTPTQPSLLLPTVESEVVNVDVFVSGKDRRPVKDLQAEDFEVFEDGQRVPIVNFLAGLKQPPEPGEPAVSVPDAPPAAARERLPEERLNVVVYLDNANLGPVTRQRVLEPLERFFVGDRPGQRVMVVTHLQGFRVRLPFTDDLALVRSTLKLISKERTEQRLSAQKRMLIARLASADIEEGGSLLFEMRNYAQEASQELQRSLTALRGTLGLMGGLPGRKLLLYVSEGLQMQPGAELFQIYANRFGDDAVNDATASPPDGAPTGGGRGAGLFSAFGDLQQSQLFKDLLSQANANRVTLYAIDASQAEAHFSVSAGERAVDVFGEVRTSDPISRTFETYEKSGSLAYLAEYTGGRSLAGNLKLGTRLAELAEDLEAGYALAYAPPRGADGKYHQIEVRSKRPGLALRHRQGYRSKTADERSGDLAFAALLGETDNPLGVALEAGAPKANDSKGVFTMPLIVKLPVGQVQLTRRSDADVGKLVVYFVVQDLNGGFSEIQKRELPLSFPAGQVKPGSKQVIGYPVPMQIKAGEYVVGVGVRDETAGRRSGASLRVKVS